MGVQVERYTRATPRWPQAWLVLAPHNLVLEVNSAQLPSRLHPNERSIAIVLQKALASPSDPGDGIVVHANAGAESVLAHLSAGGARAVVLQEDGECSVGDWLQREYSEAPEAEARPERSGLVLVIGDNEGFTASETELLGRLGLPRVTVGPLPIFASHCIVLVHNHLDLFLPPYFAMKHARKALPPSEGGRLSASSAPLETDGWCSIS